MLRSNEKDRDREHASWTQRVWPERKVMYPVQMWHEYFRITGSRSSKNRPVQILFRGSIPSSSSRDLFHRRRNVFRFASDRKTERKLNIGYFSHPRVTAISFLLPIFISVRFIQSFFVHDGISMDNTNRRTYVLTYIATRHQDGIWRGSLDFTKITLSRTFPSFINASRVLIY